MINLLISINPIQLFKTFMSYNLMNPMDRINFSNELKNGNFFIIVLWKDIFCVSVYVFNDLR